MIHSCGDCTKCCELLPVDEIYKPGFTHCHHEIPVSDDSDPRSVGQAVGCAIYANRPSTCRAWSCNWLLADTWPDEMRPDKCGVVFDGTPETVAIDGVSCTATQAWAAPGHEYDFMTPPVADAVYTAVSSGCALVWHFGVADAQAVCVIYKFGDAIICSEPTPAPKTLNCLVVSRQVARSTMPPSVGFGEGESDWDWLYDQFRKD
jgi:hypothetical protein